MRRTIHDSFADNPAAAVTLQVLPERGTGLETGSAGERRGGNPRTDAEREVRHFEQSDVDKLLRTQKEQFQREVKRGVPTAAPSNSKEEHWNKHKDVYYLKK